MIRLGITAEDRRRLAVFTRDWSLTPPGFTPNGPCRRWERLGLLEISNHEGRYRLRLTVAAFTAIHTKGEA